MIQYSPTIPKDLGAVTPALKGGQKEAAIELAKHAEDHQVKFAF